MRPQPHKALSASQTRYLLAALFVTGAATLVLEVAGARLISPFYGSSLYTWSAMITVTLVALAAGYSMGGRLADRGASLTLFARLLCAASFTVALVPVLRTPVLKATAGFGVQFGALASGAVLLAPALLLLGALGPVAIRLTTLGLDTVGRKAGDVYALSTVGSVTGAVLAGFVLVPHIPLSQIFAGAAVLLLLLGALGFRISATDIPLAQLAPAAAAVVLALWPRAASATRVSYQSESPYGQIKVVEADSGLRYLMVNGTSQSVAVTATGESDSQYCHGLEWAALLRPKAKKALVIGLGAGLVPRALETHYGMTVDVVEIDPVVARVARERFGFSPKGEVFLKDGRLLLETASEEYDLIVLDAFGSESPPYHLFTQESFAAARRRLAPGGVLAVNLVSAVRGPGDAAWMSVLKTLRSAFGGARAYVASDSYRDIANVLLFASDGALEGPAAAAARPVIREDVAFMLAHELPGDAVELGRALLLTDDYAPLESLLARTAEVWRRSLQQQAGDLLLQ